MEGHAGLGLGPLWNSGRLLLGLWDLVPLERVTMDVLSLNLPEAERSETVRALIKQLCSWKCCRQDVSED